ncbi:AraC family transcriptional regulator N-terminal domain-containing protein [Streptomyces flaveolus]|uniref:AraC family transcriptional regulator N-terminal domain-containing protein n=1 Tax=Streptomyces flaveolus TaxID=67297 RepID=UPI003F54F7C0
MYCTEHVTEPLGMVNQPMIALTAQGAKRSTTASSTTTPDSTSSRLWIYPSPHRSQAPNPAEPYLRFRLALQPAIIAQLRLEAGRPSAGRRPHDGPGIATSSADKELTDAVVRLLRLLDEPRDIPILAPGVRREILPLHYQKQLRLQEARMQLIATPNDPAAIGYAVGYNSPSQFSREYRRMFGAPPIQDAARLQTAAIVQE